MNNSLLSIIFYTSLIIFIIGSYPFSFIPSIFYNFSLFFTIFYFPYFYYSFNKKESLLQLLIISLKNNDIQTKKDKHEILQNMKSVFIITFLLNITGWIFYGGFYFVLAFIGMCNLTFFSQTINYFIDNIENF